MVKREIEMVRELAKQLTEIAALPQHEEKRALWRALNGKRPVRPMVMVDQVCWNEINADDELTLRCEDEALREWESKLRRKLYQWKHFPVDMVVEDFIRVPKAVTGISGFGIVVKEHTNATDDTNDVISHAYINQFASEEDIEKIKTPVIIHNTAETDRRLALADEIFSGIIDFRADIEDVYICVWDLITTWMGAEGVLYALIEKPEMMYAMVKRMVGGYISMLDQLEEQRLLTLPQATIHCTGAWTDDLPQKDHDPDRVIAKDLWMFGLAQIFGSISPAMFNEFEIEPMMPVYERFGLIYYGCCDPIHNRLNEVRKIPNLRKISVSPWADKVKCAGEIGKDYVFSNKPNPAFLADTAFDEDLVRRDLIETKSLCEKYGCPLEIILKDVSTVAYHPERLWRWAEIAMEVVQG